MALRLISGGDIMLGEHPAMVGRGVASRFRSDPEFALFDGIADVLHSADLAVANLEAPISDWPRFCLPSRRECRAPTQALPALELSGFNALSLANNHSQQHGTEAFLATVAALEKRGMVAIGLAGDEPGRCKPVDRVINGLPVRLLAYSLRPRQHFTDKPLYAEGSPDGMLADIAEGRNNGHVIIVSVHWGDEFVTTPSRQQVELGRAMVDAGCALVLGHHPHVLQGWERYRDAAIFYSLGNLVFDMPWLPELHWSVLCECRVTASGCADIALHPLQLSADHRPQPADGPVAENILDFLHEARLGIESSVGKLAVPSNSDYQEMVDAAADRQRWARNRYFLCNIWRYSPDVAAQLICKFLLRRLHLLHD